MGRIADDLARLVNEIQTMNEVRDNFIKGIQSAVKQKVDETRQFMKEEIQTAVKQKADETRQYLANFRNEMNCAHEAFFRRKA